MGDGLTIFLSMFVLFFGIMALLTGLFTAYFGAGKSRAIGAILTVIGIVLVLILFLLTDNDTWDGEFVKKGFIYLLGTVIGAVIGICLLIGMMMLPERSKKEEPMFDVEKDAEVIEEEPTAKEETEVEDKEVKEEETEVKEEEKIEEEAEEKEPEEAEEVEEKEESKKEPTIAEEIEERKEDDEKSEEV